MPSFSWILFPLALPFVFAVALPKQKTYGRAIFHQRGVDDGAFDRKLTRLLGFSEQKTSEQKSVVLMNHPTALAALSAFSGVTIAAKLGIFTNEVSAYSDAMIMRDLGSALITTILAAIFLKIVAFAAEKNYVDTSDSRKAVHTFSAPLFMLLWPLFSGAAGARYFAGTVLMVKLLRLYAAGTGKSNEAALANSVSRTGDLREALGGPFIYVLISIALTLAFWRDSPVAIVALSTLALGDGLADVLGRRFGANNKWPGLDKSVAGTMSFWIGATAGSIGMLKWMQHWGCLSLGMGTEDLVVRVAAITFVSAVVELIPFGDDNITVALTATLLSYHLLL